jgi:hypothetical protein
MCVQARGEVSVERPKPQIRVISDHDWEAGGLPEGEIDPDGEWCNLLGGLIRVEKQLDACRSLINRVLSGQEGAADVEDDLMAHGIMLSRLSGAFYEDLGELASA